MQISPRKHLALLSLIIVLLMAGCSGVDVTPSDEVATPSGNEAPNDNAAILKEGSSAVVETVIFESDEILNTLFIKYNQIAEYPITDDMIKRGNINSKAIISMNGLFIEAIDSANSFIVLDISDAQFNDIGEEESLFPVFRDFLVVMSTTDLTEEEVKQAWTDIKNTRYELNYGDTNNQSVFELGGVQLQYLHASNVNNNIRVSMLSFYE